MGQAPGKGKKGGGKGQGPKGPFGPSNEVQELKNLVAQLQKQVQQGLKSGPIAGMSEHSVRIKEHGQIQFSDMEEWHASTVVIRATQSWKEDLASDEKQSIDDDCTRKNLI